MRAVGVLGDARQRDVCPALEARQALVALLEDTVADEPRAQVGGRLSDVVFVERRVFDRNLAAQQRAKGRGGGASPQPGQ